MFEGIKELIAKDQIIEAITSMREIVKGREPLKILILLSGRYHNLEKLILADTISVDDIIRNRNKIRESLLNFILELEGEETDFRESYLIDKGELLNSILQIQQVLENLYANNPSNIPNLEAFIDALKDIDKQLQKFQSIIDSISILSIDEAEELWIFAHEYTDLIYSNRNQSSDDLLLRDKIDDNMKISILARYFSVMRSFADSLKKVPPNLLAVFSPEIENNLTRIWRFKIGLNHIIHQMKEGDRSSKALAEQLHDNQLILSFIEATRTLEGRVLYQVVDADAREVAQDFETGLTVFGELVKNSKKLSYTVNSTRQDIRDYITKNQ